MLYLPTLVQNIEISFKDVDFEIEVSSLNVEESNLTVIHSIYPWYLPNCGIHP